VCEAEAGRRWEGWTECARDARALRWAGVGLGALGLVVGTAIGVTAAEVGR
jgi:hypothetical protein